MHTVDTGLEVLDLQGDVAFARRALRVRHVSTPIEGVNRLARILIEAPDTILQELVQAAIDLCGADSAGMSMEVENGTDERFYEWVATAGEYSKFLHAMLPRVPSACGLCLERARPQLFRVSQRFFDLMGVRAAEVTDGILLPWQVENSRGTLWIMAHGRTEAFDQDDCRIMRILADVAAMGVRQQRSRKCLEKQAQPGKGSDSRVLARRFDNSLQGMKTALYVAEWSRTTDEEKMVAEEMTGHLEELSGLVRQLLRLPLPSIRPN